MKAWLHKFMNGRYGSDELGRAISFFSLALLIIHMFTAKAWIYYLAIVALLSSLFRMLSKNAYKRRQENQAYKKLTSAAVAGIKQRYMMFKQRKTHRFYKCPSCGQYLRVPKGAGKISVRCPKCDTRFEKNA